MKLLQNSICAFLDVLGYTSMSLSEEKQEKILSSFMETINSSIAQIERDRKSYDLRSKNDVKFKYRLFSDNLFIYMNLKEISRYDIQCLIQSIANYQLKLSAQGFVLRGGITVGKCHFGDNFIFGPGLIEAYRLENKVAIYPRVVIDRSVISLMENTILSKSMTDWDGPATVPFNFSCPNKCCFIIKDIDNKYFINYLDLIFYEDYPGNGYDNMALPNHKHYILKGLKDSRKDSTVHQKYLWLANYHNFVIDKHQDIVQEVAKYRKSSLKKELGRIKVRDVGNRPFRFLR